LNAARVERILSAAVLLAVVVAIAWGWLNRADTAINPEHGFGYALGIVGASMMLILLGYPLRKRSRKRARSGLSVGFWFRFHMLLGLLGPLAVLYHARFGFGSLNEAVALSAMIVVASSGLIGRFFYSRVHRGFSQRKLELKSLKTDMDRLIAGLADAGLDEGEIRDQIQPCEDLALKAGSAFWSSAAAVLGVGFSTRFAERRLKNQLMQIDHDEARDLSRLAQDFFVVARRAAEFGFYDRLLRLWHMFHLPLFILMVLAVLLHVLAVHMY